MPIADQGARTQIPTVPTSGLELCVAIEFNGFSQDRKAEKGEEMSAMMKRTFIGLFAILLIVGGVWAQEETVVEEVEGVGEEQEIAQQEELGELGDFEPVRSKRSPSPPARPRSPSTMSR